MEGDCSKRSGCAFSRTGLSRNHLRTRARLYSGAVSSHLTASSTFLRIRPRAALALVSVIGLVFLSTPRFNGWPLLHLHKEDGTVFLADWTRLGSQSLSSTYTGYLHAVPRVFTAIAASVAPPQLFAVTVGVLAALWRVWLMLICFAALRSRSVPTARAIAASSLFIFVPVGQQEALANLTNLRWFCDAALVVLLIGRFRGRLGAAAAVTAVACVLTDPLSLLLLPLALWAAVRSGGWARVTPVATIVGIACHFVLMETGARQADWSGWLGNPVALIEQILVRGITEPQYGETGAEVLIKLVGIHLALAALVLPLAVLLLARDRLSSILAICGLYLLAATLMFTTPELISLDRWWGVGQASRYAVTPSILVGMALVLSSARIVRTPRRPIAVICLAVLTVATLADAQGDRRSSDGPTWSSTVKHGRADCQRSNASTITLPVTPVNDSTKWTTTLTCAWLDP